MAMPGVPAWSELLRDEYRVMAALDDDDGEVRELFSYTHSMPLTVQLAHVSLCSSHFTWRDLQLLQPLLDFL